MLVVLLQNRLVSVSLCLSVFISAPLCLCFCLSLSPSPVFLRFVVYSGPMSQGRGSWLARLDLDYILDSPGACLAHVQRSALSALKFSVSVTEASLGSPVWVPY